MIDIKIFTTQKSDAESVVPKNSFFIPIAGKDKMRHRETPLAFLSSSGDNIHKEPSTYCELETQYWAWKNISAEYYGFCHYRRYFSFSDKKMPVDIYGAINYDYFDEKAMDELCLDRESIERKVSGFDFLVTTPADFKKVKMHSLYEQYEKIPQLYVKDLYCIIDILEEKYPEYVECAREYLSGTQFFPCNMFIMKREFFYAYSEWLFNILQEFERRTDFSSYSVESYRTTGHLGERLLGIFYTYVKKNRPECKLGILQRCIVWRPDVPILPTPFFKENNIPIVLAFSDYFVPYAAITIHSILSHINEDANYDFLILHTGVSPKSQESLLRLCLKKTNVSLRFIDISNYVAKLNLIENNHVSVETFYRLIAGKILKNYEKVIYLDSDLIVLRDIKQLFEIDLSNALLGATIDADHAGEYNGAIPNVKKYTDTVLGLHNPYSYFQAGVLILNIQAMLEEFGEDGLMEMASRREYMYVDQDVLNMCCEGKTMELDMRWNVMVDCLSIRKDDLIRCAPSKIFYEYLEARKQPYIIHYAGVEKPWNTPDSDFSGVFWKYARETEFYEAIIKRMTAIAVQDRTRNSLFSKSGKLYKFADRLFPKGSRRREIIKKIFGRFIY